MHNFIRKPDISLYPGIVVTKDTVLEYQSGNLLQKVENLVLHAVTQVKGDGYESTYDTTVRLQEGDILLFEDQGRGYIKPVDAFVTVQEAIGELTSIQDLG